ncbi:cobalamin-dependent protein [soil metagenome]
MTPPSTTLHPIGIVAERTGLSLDVLRVWERRYGVVEPTRDDAGRRLYTDADIERLRLLAQATWAGRSIGQISSLSVESLRDLVRDTESARWTASRAAAPGNATAGFVEEALNCARAMNGVGVEDVLRRAVALLGVPVFLEDVVAVLVRRVGDEWHAGQLSIAQEHLVSAVVRPLLAQLRRTLPVSGTAPAVLVGTLAGERHDIGALLAAAAASVEGWRVTYVGADLPAQEIADAALETGARAVALSSVHVTDPVAAAAEVRALRASLPGDVAILLGGAGLAALDGEIDGLDILKLQDLTGLRSYLRDGAFKRDSSV